MPLFARLGPGILFAAAAIGVSHLVQSTRAGAMYGLALAVIIVVTCVLKYPALRFGAMYPAATGESLLENYRRQGAWALFAYGVILLYAMWFILAAVTVTTAGIAQALLPPGVSLVMLSAGLLLLAATLLLAGGYRWLEAITKYLMLLLVVLLLAVTGLALPGINWSWQLLAFPRLDLPLVLFLIALAGWMPIPVDAAVVTSTWAATRARAHGGQLPRADAAFDFNVGYIGATLTALCFLLLGTAVMWAAQVEPAGAAGPFAAQVIGLFTAQIGDWSFYLIGVVALLTMFSTVLTVLDGSPRQILFIVREQTPLGEPRWLYPALIVVFALGGLTVVAFFMQSFATFIDFATSLGFLSAPLIVFLNHRAMFGPRVSDEYRPGTFLRLASIVGGVVITLVSGLYFALRLAGVG